MMFEDTDDDDVPLGNLRKKVKKTNGKKVKPETAPSSSSASKKRKLAKKSKEGGSAKKKAKVKKESSSSSPTKPKRELKKLDKTERLQYAMQSFLWWDAEEPPPGCQWGTMQHAGVSFPEPYVPHGVKMIYDGEEVELTPVQEEA